MYIGYDPRNETSLVGTSSLIYMEETVKFLEQYFPKESYKIVEGYEVAGEKAYAVNLYNQSGTLVITEIFKESDKASEWLKMYLR